MKIDPHGQIPRSQMRRWSPFLTFSSPLSSLLRLALLSTLLFQFYCFTITRIFLVALRVNLFSWWQSDPDATCTEHHRQDYSSNSQHLDMVGNSSGQNGIEVEGPLRQSMRVLLRLGLDL